MANKIELGNLREKHVFEYVSDTMSQPIETDSSTGCCGVREVAWQPFHGPRELLQTVLLNAIVFGTIGVARGGNLTLTKSSHELSGAD